MQCITMGVVSLARVYVLCLHTKRGSLEGRICVNLPLSKVRVSFFNYVDQILPIINHLPTHGWHLWKKSITVKVEKILKGSLDLISSPSEKIQIMDGKVCLRFKGKTLLSVVNNFFCFQKFVDNAQHYLALHLKPTFPPIIWIFPEGEDDGI